MLAIDFYRLNIAPVNGLWIPVPPDSTREVSIQAEKKKNQWVPGNPRAKCWTACWGRVGRDAPSRLQSFCVARKLCERERPLHTGAFRVEERWPLRMKMHCFPWF